MNKLQFGPLFFPTKEGPEALELARMADDLGYDYFWVPDYVTLPTWMPLSFSQPPPGKRKT